MNDEFSAIATEKLLRLFPEISPYIVNFSDVTDELAREDDDTMVGMFVASLGGKYYYIPIVGKGSVVQSIDSLFDPETQEFTPLTKQSLSALIATQSKDMGRKTRIPQTVSQNPSVYGLVVPPRTAKVAYAGTSRFVEALASAPDLVKRAFVEQVKKHEKVASALNRYYDMADVFKALKEEGAAPATEQAKDLEFLTQASEGLSEAEIQSILEKGYALRGVQKETRVAIPANDYARMGRLTQVTRSDGGKVFEIVTKSGETRQGLILEQAKEVPQPAALTRPAAPLVLFSNGDFASSMTPVAQGEGTPGLGLLQSLFTYRRPISTKEVGRGDSIVILNDELKLVAALHVHGVELSSLGARITGNSIIPGVGCNTIYAYNTVSRITAQPDGSVFVPVTTSVITLAADISQELEVNVNSAQAKVELSNLMTLGGMSTIRHDGVSFSYNGKAVGGVPDMVRILVVNEGINPTAAGNFTKQAQVGRICSFYMSKKADYAGGDIPQYGTPLEQQQDQYEWGAGKAGNGFASNVDQAAQTGDSELMEASLLTELLQAPDMHEYIQEYLPEIKTGIDKLGRILFLVKVNLSHLFTGENATEIFNLVGTLRNVYRSLGDAYIKLERLAYDTTSQSNSAEQTK